MTCDEFTAQYALYGEDPFIIGADEKIPFSARDYASVKAEEICQSSKTSTPEKKPCKLLVYKALLKVRVVHLESNQISQVNYKKKWSTGSRTSISINWH